MVSHKKELLAAAAVVVVLSAVALGFAFVTHEPSQRTGSNAPTNPTDMPTASPTAPASTATNGPSLYPTQTPTPTPASTPPPTKTISNGLELTMSLEKTVYNIGEPVNVTLTITNISQQTVNFTSTGMNFDFIVYNGTYNLVYQWSIGKAFPDIAFIEPLAPGANVTATYTWPQTFNTAESPINLQVSPGTYYVVGESNPTLGLQTAPIQVTILDP